MRSTYASRCSPACSQKSEKTSPSYPHALEKSLKIEKRAYWSFNFQFAFFNLQFSILRSFRWSIPCAQNQRHGAGGQRHERQHGRLDPEQRALEARLQVGIFAQFAQEFDAARDG